jgi:hypothetical protein
MGKGNSAVARMVQAFYHGSGGLMAHRGSTRATERTMIVTSLALAAWWVLVLAPRAEAYIDPSAGGMLVQLVLAGTAGVAVLGKLFWGRIKSLFGVRESETPASPSGDTKSPHDRV